MKMTPTKNNPRYANGNLRRKHRARLRGASAASAMGGSGRFITMSRAMQRIR